MFTPENRRTEPSRDPKSFASGSIDTTFANCRDVAVQRFRRPASKPGKVIPVTVLSDDSGLVFPSPRGKPLSDMTLSKLLKEQGIEAVPHGFRSSFRDWAAEETDHPREVVEAALAHQVKDKVEAAYQRSTLFERRRRLMEDWSSYLSQVPGQKASTAERRRMAGWTRRAGGS